MRTFNYLFVVAMLTGCGAKQLAQAGIESWKTGVANIDSERKYNAIKYMNFERAREISNEIANPYYKFLAKLDVLDRSLSQNHLAETVAILQETEELYWSLDEDLRFKYICRMFSAKTWVMRSFYKEDNVDLVRSYKMFLVDLMSRVSENIDTGLLHTELALIEGEISDVEADISNIRSSFTRSLNLIRLLQYQLEKQQDPIVAQSTIDKVNKTMDFIQYEKDNVQRIYNRVLQENNHLICR